MNIDTRELPSDGILCWSDVFVTDDGGKPVKRVKKLVLTIEAGGVAKLDIETYRASLKTTKISSYCVDDITIKAADWKRIVKNKSKKAV